MADSISWWVIASADWWLTLAQLLDKNFSFLNGSSVQFGSAVGDALTGANLGDFLDVSRGGTDTMFGGDGNDQIFARQGMSAGDVIYGGNGMDDRIVLEGAVSLSTAGFTVEGVERFVFLGGGSLNLS